MLAKDMMMKSFRGEAGAGGAWGASIGPTMIFAHQVVVLCLRYIIENLDEDGILAIDREADVANCSVTEYRFDPDAGKRGNLVLVRYNATAPMEDEHAPVTRARDQIVAARG